MSFLAQQASIEAQWLGTVAAQQENENLLGFLVWSLLMHPKRDLSWVFWYAHLQSKDVQVS